MCFINGNGNLDLGDLGEVGCFWGWGEEEAIL